MADNHITNERPIGDPRDTGLGPNYVDFDARLTWQHKLGEHASLLLTAEGFNIANHTNYASVNNEVSPLFGFRPGSPPSTCTAAPPSLPARLSASLRPCRNGRFSSAADLISDCAARNRRRFPLHPPPALSPEFQANNFAGATGLSNFAATGGVEMWQHIKHTALFVAVTTVLVLSIADIVARASQPHHKNRLAQRRRHLPDASSQQLERNPVPL